MQLEADGSRAAGGGIPPAHCRPWRLLAAVSGAGRRSRRLHELGLAGTPYERVKGLKEQNYGIFEGLTEDTNPPRGTLGFYAQFGGESEEEAAARMAACMAELMAREGQGVC